MLGEKDKEKLEEYNKLRIQALEKIIKVLHNAATSNFDKKQFSSTFSLAICVLELTPGNLADEFMISKPSVSRWANGKSAPHPLGRKPVFEALEIIAKEKLQLYFYAENINRSGVEKTDKNLKLKTAINEVRNGEGWYHQHLKVMYEESKIYEMDFTIGNSGLQNWLPDLLQKVYELGQENPVEKEASN